MEQQMGGPGMMMGGQGQGPSRVSLLYRQYTATFNESLLLGLGLATLVAVAASIVVSEGIARPVRGMMQASRRIAEGHFSERVQVSGSDELAELGRHFNEMAARLEQVELRRRELIGDVAHELRTPLTAIKGSMEGLMDGVLPPTSETYELIHRKAGRLDRLVDDLQELSRAEAGASSLDLQPLDLNASIQTVMQRLGRGFDEKRVRLEADLPANGLMVKADAYRIEQVILNLLANAQQYTQEGGAVSVTAREVEGMARVTVQDNGMGIPAEHLAHIFDRFYRVEKSRSRTRGGSGIGLTIARQLVENHGGRIWAESKGEGKGSVFQFTLPLAD
jgi:histidine kinase